MAEEQDEQQRQQQAAEAGGGEAAGDAAAEDEAGPPRPPPGGADIDEEGPEEGPQPPKAKKRKVCAAVAHGPAGEQPVARPRWCVCSRCGKVTATRPWLLLRRHWPAPRSSSSSSSGSSSTPPRSHARPSCATAVARLGCVCVWWLAMHRQAHNTINSNTHTLQQQQQTTQHDTHRCCRSSSNTWMRCPARRCTSEAICTETRSHTSW
jgi:hypothetical protein